MPFLGHRERVRVQVSSFTPHDSTQRCASTATLVMGIDRLSAIGPADRIDSLDEFSQLFAVRSLSVYQRYWRTLLERLIDTFEFQLDSVNHLRLYTVQSGGELL